MLAKVNRKTWLASLLLLNFAVAGVCPGFAQQGADRTGQLPSIAQITSEPAELHGAPVNPSVLPTDLTPLTLQGEREFLSRETRYKILRRLPERLWFNVTNEVSQRLDTNVFMTYSHPKSDYVFRALPNISVGYNVLKRTSVYCNYFMVKDVFADHTILNNPTTQSLSYSQKLWTD